MTTGNISLDFVIIFLCLTSTGKHFLLPVVVRWVCFHTQFHALLYFTYSTTPFLSHRDFPTSTALKGWAICHTAFRPPLVLLTVWVLVSHVNSIKMCCVLAFLTWCFRNQRNFSPQNCSKAFGHFNFFPKWCYFFEGGRFFWKNIFEMMLFSTIVEFAL